jgi:hypothetical protein
MSYKLFITLPSQAEAEYTNLLLADWAYTQDGFGAELASVRNSLQLDILYNNSLVQDLLTATMPTLARFTYASTEIFRGVIEPLKNVTLGRTENSISITVNDLNSLLDVNPVNFFISDGWLSHGTDTAKSIVHKLLTGVTGIDTSLLPTLNSGTSMASNVPVLGYRPDINKSIYDNLRDVLSQNGFYHYFQGNKLVIASFARSTASPDYVLTDAHTINGSVSLSKESTSDFDSVRVKYHKITNESNKKIGSLTDQISRPYLGSVNPDVEYRDAMRDYYKGLPAGTFNSDTLALNGRNNHPTAQARRNAYNAGTYKPWTTSRFIYAENLDPMPVCLQTRWDALPSGAKIVDYTNVKVRTALTWTGPDATSGKDKHTYSADWVDANLLETNNLDIDSNGVLRATRMLKNLEIEQTLAGSGIFGAFAVVRKVKDIYWYVKSLEVTADLKVKTIAGTIDLQGPKKKYKEVVLEDVYSKAQAEAYAYFMKNVQLQNSQLSFESYNNYDINKTVSLTSAIAGLSFAGLIAKKSYDHSTKKYKYTALLTQDVSLLGTVEFEVTGTTISQEDWRDVLSKAIDPATGVLIAPVESPSLPAVGTPDKSGLFLGSDKFGYYDHLTGTWPVEITSTGQAKFSGEVQATSGKFTGEVQATSGKFTGEVQATSGTFAGTIIAGAGQVGGWIIQSTDIRSAIANKRIQLDQAKNRVEVWGDTGAEPKTAMGYLGGLSNPANRTQTLDNNVFGFWAGVGDTIDFKGDVNLDGSFGLNSDKILWAKDAQQTPLLGFGANAYGSKGIQFRRVIGSDTVIKHVGLSDAGSLAEDGQPFLTANNGVQSGFLSVNVTTSYKYIYIKTPVPYYKASLIIKDDNYGHTRLNIIFDAWDKRLETSTSYDPRYDVVVGIGNTEGWLRVGIKGKTQSLWLAIASASHGQGIAELTEIAPAHIVFNDHFTEILESWTNKIVGSTSTSNPNNTLQHITLSGYTQYKGVLTFTDSPIVPTPTTNTQVANKAYVDKTTRTTTGNATLSSTDRVVFATSNSANQSFTIPSGLPIGTTIKIIKTEQSNHTITLARSGSETIEGATSWVSHGAHSVTGTGRQTVEITKQSAINWIFSGGAKSGSNSNGSYIMYPDGTMIQSRNAIAFTFSNASAWEVGVTYPVAFASLSAFVFGVTSHISGVEFVLPTHNAVTPPSNIGAIPTLLTRTGANATGTATGSYIATGRWK